MSNIQTANIVVNGENITLNVGDCIEFTRTDVREGMNPITKAKILRFSFENEKLEYFTWLPWREKEQRWGTTSYPPNIISFTLKQSTNGLPNTIKKINCPDEQLGGGKRKKLRATKKRRRATKKRRRATKKRRRICRR